MSRRHSKNLELAPAETGEPPRYQIEQELAERKIDLQPLPRKRFLILCEGETEQAYFEGLKSNQILQFRLASVDVDVIPPGQVDDQNLKGLIWEAMRRNRRSVEEENPYDEIWIVIDNDNRNSYWVSPACLDRVEGLLNANEFQQWSIQSNRHFLSLPDLLFSLEMNLGPGHPGIRQVAKLIDHLSLFEALHDPDLRKLFYREGIFDYGQEREEHRRPLESDFDPDWKTYVNIAYSGICFEVWLILHFERTDHTYTASKGLIQYIQQYAPQYSKGGGSWSRKQANAYEALKPTPLAQKYETSADAVEVLNKVNSAIENGYWLRQRMDEKCAQRGVEYYEIIPYTTVQDLVSRLLGQSAQLFYGRMGATFQWHGLELHFQFFPESSELSFSLNNLSSRRVLINPVITERLFSIHFSGEQSKQPHLFLPAALVSGTLNLLPGEQGEGRVRFELPEDLTELCLHVRFSEWTEDVIVIPLSGT